jgi:hypothetical protein
LRKKYELGIFAKRSVAVMKFIDSRNPDDHFAPLSETSADDFPVVPGRQQMVARTKERCDHPKGREKPLGVSG